MHNNHKDNNFYLYTDIKKDHFYDCIVEFTKALKNVKKDNITIVPRITKFPILLKLLRFASRYVKISRLSVFKKSDINLTVQIGPELDLFVKKGLFYENNYLYVFDCWEKYIHWLVPLSKTFRIKAIFFSSKQSAALFNAYKVEKSETSGVWLPEGIQLDDYKHYSANEKSIDILEFGRKYDFLHKKIKTALFGTRYTHLYQKEGELPLFPDKSSFVTGLAKSKICICVPSNITHPERAGNISTMTLRYLQAMASKCLIVGVLPYDMKELFTYNPVVEIDFSNDVERQIIDILKNYNQYQDLIEKNYQNLIKNHTWESRIETMLNHIYE